MGVASALPRLKCSGRCAGWTGGCLPVPGPVTPQLVALYGAAVEAGEEPDEDSPEAVADNAKGSVSSRASSSVLADGVRPGYAACMMASAIRAPLAKRSDEAAQGRPGCGGGEDKGGCAAHRVLGRSGQPPDGF